MKKTIAAVLSVIFVFFASAIAAEDPVGYHLPEPGLSITVPAGYEVYARNMSPDDPFLQEQGLTPENVNEMLEPLNAYLCICEPDEGYEVQVRMIPSSAVDFGNMGETLLMSMSETWISEYSAYGINVVSTDIYRHPQTLFLRYYWTQEDEGITVYGLQYYTVIHDQAINITLFSYAGPITPAHEQLMLRLVDSIRFDGVPEATPEPMTPPNKVYTDPVSGVSFTVPDYWEEKPLNKEREILKVKFGNTSHDASLIMYGYYDIWAELSDSAKKLYPRAKVNMSQFSKAGIASLLGCSEEELTLEYFGGEPYYRLKNDADMVFISIPQYIWIHIENGYMHLFLFNGYPGTRYYGSMEALLASARY